MSSYYYGSGRSTSSRSFFRTSAKRPTRQMNENWWRRFNTYYLPAILLVANVITTGSYYETNDDMTLSLLLRGIFAAHPVNDLHLYLYGIGHVIAGLYTNMPKLPWYGLTMFAGLYLSMMLSFGLLHRLGRRLFSNEQLAMLLLFLYISAWLEHTLWFNYTRIPVLLAATAFLSYGFTDKTPGPQHTRHLILNALAFLLALCIRPNAALFGLILALPGALRIPSREGLDVRNLVATSVPFGVVIAFFFAATLLTRTEEDVAYERVNRYNQMYHDYGLYSFKPMSRGDTVRAYAVREWMLGDRAGVNEPFFRRAGGINWGKFFERKVPIKLVEVIPRLFKDYFLLMIFNLLVIWLCIRKINSPTRLKLLIFTQVWVAVVMFLVAVFLKLPPRLAAPGFTILTLLNVTFYLRHRRFKAPVLPLVIRFVLLLALGGHVYRTGWRVQQLSDRQRRDEAFINSLRRQFQGRLLVMSSLESYLSALSPLTNYKFTSLRVFPMTGWNTMDPSYKEYYKELTGETQWNKAVQKLAYDERALWIVSVGFTDRLNTYLGTLHADSVRLMPFRPNIRSQMGKETVEYRVGIPPGTNTAPRDLPGVLISPDSVTSMMESR